MSNHFLPFLVLIGFLLPHSGSAQSAVTPSSIGKTYTLADTARQAAVQFADSIFHRSSFSYERVEPEIPEDIQNILVRFNNAIVANKQWFYEYKNAYAGQTLPYNQRFGISADEYKKLQNLEKTPPQLVPVDTQKVTVIREGGYIRFKTDGDSHLLDYFQIDLQQLFVVYGGDTIPFAGRTATTASSPYGEWQGFTWRLQKADAASTIATSRVTARVVEINLGLPAQQPTGRVFLRIKYQDMRDGETAANLELVGYIH
ncbi:hypothetical protein [Puia dinghuensis]|uniref:Uncharacterized protein n=1 Tax=Puia dinghuensis TaxID=1792502 RepID=A0A8J2XRT9_9BACT|nr:hypothetical protein [Puia dinghuensis]GGB04169.1 hypothetical protein GCM10011511_29360 [Puia dinghuensis]